MWLFSKAMIGQENSRSLQEQVAESSAGSYSGGDASARSKKTPTLLAYCSHGKMTVPSSLSRYGTMFAHLTVDLGEELLTSYRAGFPARISVSPVKAPESRESEVVSGKNSRASLAKFDPLTCSWKTHQLSLLRDSGLSSATFSRWGMMRSGELFPLKMPALHIAGSDSGLLPTLTVCGNYNRKGASSQSGDGLATVLGGPPNPNWTEWFMGFPVGWTALDALGMGKCPLAPRSRGISFQDWVSMNR